MKVIYEFYRLYKSHVKIVKNAKTLYREMNPLILFLNLIIIKIGMSEYEFIGSAIFWRHQDNTKVSIIVYLFELFTALKSMNVINKS